MFPITSEKEVFAKKNKINFDKSEENINITSEKVQRRTEKKDIGGAHCAPLGSIWEAGGRKSWRRIECPSTNLLHKINFPIKKCWL